MTTPAVSINSVLNTDCSWWRRNFGPGGVPGSITKIADSSVMTRWTIRERPASVKSTKDSSGWRPPLGYYANNQNGAIHAPVWIFSNRNPDGSGFDDYHYDGDGVANIKQPVPAYPSYLEGAAVGKALTKLKDKSVDFGVAFGQYKETAELVASSATRIAKVVRGFRGKFPREWGQVVKNQVRQAVGTKPGQAGRNIPSAWLELQYGLNPTISDVNSACEELSDTASGGHPFRCTVKASSKEEINETLWGTLGSAPLGWVRIVRQGKHFCFIRLDYELDSPLLATFSSLGLTNPLSVAYELFPYSFLLDYFLPIGDWLNTMDADFGWRFLSGTRTTGQKYTEVGTGTVTRPGWAVFPTSGLVSSSCSNLSMNRFVYPVAPSAGFPTFKNPLSVGHVANALSLLVNAFR